MDADGIFQAAVCAMRFVYLIGAPGSGKSTVAAALRALAGKSQLYEEPIPHMVQWRGGVPWYAEIGKVRDGFSGTDALAMDIIGPAIIFMMNKPYRRLLAEGDRLANDRFFGAVRHAGYDLRVYCLAIDAAILEERRRLRAERLGTSLQNAVWLRGRATKVATLSQAYNATLLDATQLPQVSAQEIRSFLT
jgi:energy-coupling factor transporter ATP-binding protein EcfA2